MKKTIIVVCVLSLNINVNAQKKNNATSGNPVFKGWYADPEATIFNKQYWIYPTYSAAYDQQVFFDAFSSADLVHWAKHNRILDTSDVKWAKTCCVGACYCKKG